MKLKAISLKQPYANLVVRGQKTIETRKWSTHYRGDILICSSRSGVGEPKEMALCLVRLIDIRPMTASDAAAACIELYPKAKAWIISDLRVLKHPIPVKGRLGLFEVEITNHQLIFN